MASQSVVFLSWVLTSLLDDHAPPLQTADGSLVQVEVVKRPPYATVRARA